MITTPTTADAIPTICRKLIRRLDHAQQRLLGQIGKRREQQSFNDEHEPERDKKIRHHARPLAVPLPKPSNGRGGVRPRALPLGSTK